jgi:hypothetical protein
MSEKEEKPNVLLIVGVTVGVLGVSVGLPLGIGHWKSRAHTPQELATYDFEKHHEDLRIDSKGMQGTYARFDVVANAAFADSLAKIWDPQAQLVRVKVKRCDRSGTIDLTEEESRDYVNYEFVALGSASRDHSNVTHASETTSDVTSNAPHTSLKLEFDHGKLVASNGSESPVDAPPPVFNCPMDRLAALIATANVTTYSLDLRPRRIRMGKDASGTKVYKTFWRWEASGEGNQNAVVCADTCTLEGSPDCPARW